MPLVSYIRNSLRFWYYASLSTCCQNLEKNWGHREIWETAVVKLLRDLTEKSVNFSTLATSNIRLLLVFGKEDQQTKLILNLHKTLRTTVPLVSYIRNPLRFLYYASLSTCCQILKKIGVTGKIWEKAGVKLLRDLTEKSVNFSTLATSNIRLLLVFGKEDQQTKLILLVRKKFMITEEKLGKMTTF